MYLLLFVSHFLCPLPWEKTTSRTKHEEARANDVSVWVRCEVGGKQTDLYHH